MTDFSHINSATKYPSIGTYHRIDPGTRTGELTEERVEFTGEVLGTEKVDGGNGRVIVLPYGDFLIGSREEILYAMGDRVVNPIGAIVPTLLPVADRIMGRERSGLGDRLIEVYFFEVYGHRIGGSSKQYTTTPGLTGCRLFDVATVPPVVVDMEREVIARWRDNGGQKWLPERHLQHAALEVEVEVTPRLSVTQAGDMPATIEGMYEFLKTLLPTSLATLDETGGGSAEGVVFRTADRGVIAKARFQDYERTFRARTEAARKSRR